MAAKNVPFWTVQQIAAMLKIHRERITKAIKSGELKTLNERVEGKRFYAKVAPAVAKAWAEENFPKSRRLPFTAANVVQSSARIPTSIGPGRLTSIDEKLDAILAGIERLETLWS